MKSNEVLNSRKRFALYCAHKCPRCDAPGVKTFYNLKSRSCPIGWKLFTAWFGEDRYESITATVRRKIEHSTVGAAI